jgi:glutamyl-Q tRNA(Asp) synthetase
MVYQGRFAPSPSGPLHAGSLVAALASWLDARAHGGQWLVRIEDIDGPRIASGATDTILAQLQACGMTPDEAPVFQSQRSAIYQAALDQLNTQGHVYRCACTRREIGGDESGRYPGTCREGLQGKAPRAWRLRVDDAVRIDWQDRRLGAQVQDIALAVGDFVVKRADGPWAYQLAVVADDAEQGITDVVRGEDLADNTARQIHLQHLLGLPTPRYLHTQLVRDAQGRKLSKSNGAMAVDVAQPLHALRAAARALELAPIETATVADFLQRAVAHWQARYDDVCLTTHSKAHPCPSPPPAA